MRLLADENIPLPRVHLLRQAGHEVEAVAEFAPGAQDPRVLAYAADHDLVLVTFDRDFGQLTYSGDAPVPGGVLFLRLIPSDPEEVGRLLHGLLAPGGLDPLGRLLPDLDRR